MLELQSSNGELFSAEAASELFTKLDKDGSGTLDYNELKTELRRDPTIQSEKGMLKKASRLLYHTDVVPVIGIPSRAKRVSEACEG